MMKKLLNYRKMMVALSILGASSMNGQCLTATNGLYPTATFAAAVCDGTTDNTITTLAYNNEYSNVSVTSGETYVFRTSIATDFITISNSGGTTAYTSGVGPLTWVSTVTGTVRFYSHDNASCVGSDSFRSRIFKCGTPPVCTNPIVDIPYTMGFETVQDGACITIENVNGATTWSIFTGTTSTASTGTKSIRYNWDATAPGDDWFYTAGLNLTAGTSYTLTFNYKSSDGPTYVENLEVKFGTAANAAAMTSAPIVTLAGINSAIASPFQSSTSTFTPPTTGVYYVGFHNTSVPDQAFLYVDDISITATLSVGDFNLAKLSAHPNPVKDMLNLTYTDAITNVTIYNLVGQQVMVKSFDSNEAKMDLSSLQTGNYIAKVTTSDGTKNLKIVKQ